MSNIVLVGIGGFIGAIMRYLVGVYIAGDFTKSIPIHTLFINVIGCFLFGYFVNHNFILNSNYPIKEFVLIGILGGFTTYSTFSYECITLVQRGNYQTAIIYVLLSLFLGVIAVILGLNIYRIYT